MVEDAAAARQAADARFELDKELGEHRMRERVVHIGDIRTKPTDFPPIPGAPGRETYGWIAFEGLGNTRDLGHLVGADGREVKPGLLLRSGTLAYARGDDLKRLRDIYELRLVVDLRDEEELIGLPDPMDALPSARLVHAPILPGRTQGITQEDAVAKEEERERAELEREATADDHAFMLHMYRFMLLSRVGIEGYRTFFRELLATTEGAALWHCHVGRDRCGMASALVEVALGVSWEDIVADYLATNLFASERETTTYPAFRDQIEAARAGVERTYGSFMGYLTEALGLTDADIAELRRRYLV